MTLQLQLTDDEARLLASHLSWHLRQLDAELIRTDKHELQHALAVETEEIRHLVDRLRVAVPEPTTVPAGSATARSKSEPQEMWPEAFTDGEGNPIPREDFEGV